MKEDKNYEQIQRKLACSNSLFEVYYDKLRFRNYQVENYLTIKPKTMHGPKKIAGICILPELDSSFLLMKGWRHQFDEFIWQAPSGFVELGENPFDTALRELKEETALICDPENLVSLGSFIPDAGLIEGRVSLFLARNCKKISNIVDQEVGTGLLYPFSDFELKNLIKTSSNIGGSTITACFRSIEFLSSNNL